MSTENNKVEPLTILEKSEGVTDAERYLQRLAEKSFLSLWSYPNVFRDEGLKKKGGTCQEVCDLLVVFEDHLIIFSDKDCVFPDTGDLDLDWSRWYRKAVLKSAQQIWGAESHILKFPGNLFLDPACTRPFPIDLPAPDKVKVHRILVAHSASERCKKELGGSGSLMIIPGVVGSQHVEKREDGGVPFAIGQIDPTRGYVHVFDDTTLEIVMKTLDTITDLVEYLSRKEQFVTSGRLKMASGEEDMLAVYLQHYDEDDKHDFVLPAHMREAIIPAGWWTQFAKSTHRKAQIAENKISYIWDLIIEESLGSIIKGTSYILSHEKLADSERTWRLLARESRMHRRVLAQSLTALVLNTPATKFVTHIMPPADLEQPYYLFLAFPTIKGLSDQEYLKARQQHLLNRCMIAKLELPHAEDIIGICKDKEKPGTNLIHINAKKWTPSLQSEAESVNREFQKAGLRSERSWNVMTVEEYPVASTSAREHTHGMQLSEMKGRDRNAPCWCGSRKKFKKCHG